MNYLAAFASAALLAFVLKYLNVIALCSEAWGQLHASTGILRDRTRSDNEKEREARRAAWVMLRYVVLILPRVALAVALPSLALVGLVAAHVIDWASLTHAFVSPLFIALGIVVSGYMLLRRR
jgi:hypothetical protein